MTRSLAVRLLLALAALLLLGGLLAFALSGFDRLLALWERALAATPVLAALYAVFLLAFAAASVTLLWWILRPATPRKSRNAVPSETELGERLQHNEALGLDVTEADNELAELNRRREAGELHIALYGQISAGKSSLIRALLPQAKTETNVLGGTTRRLERHAWHSPGKDAIYITDAPGINASDAQDEALARDEALRAHIVVYVCEGDLTRDQVQAIDRLLTFGKPLIIAINKIDRLAQSDLNAIKQRIQTRYKDAPRVSLVTLQTGGEEQLIRQTEDGSEHTLTRAREPNITELLDAIQTQLETQTKALTQLRDSAVLQLASGKLDAALDAQRLERADALVSTYTRRAIVGAMAALTPGSDLVIQGALATQFVRELCALYNVKARELQVDHLLKSANKKLRRNSALVLAVAGNGLKAFPGVGTITGGLMHAVAYGLLFDTLGRAMVHSLRTRGEIAPEPTARVFESMLDEDLLPRARRLAGLALKRDAQ